MFGFNTNSNTTTTSTSSTSNSPLGISKHNEILRTGKINIITSVVLTFADKYNLLIK